MLSDGDIKLIGSPSEVGRAYLAENFATTHRDIPQVASSNPDERVRLVDAWVSTDAEERVDAVGYGERFTIHVEIEAQEAVSEPGMAVWLTTEDGVRVFSVGARENGGALGDLEAGERVAFTMAAHNPLSAGRYHIGCTVVRGSAGLDILMHHDRVGDFVSYGVDLVGVIGIDHESSVTRGSSRERVAG